MATTEKAVTFEPTEIAKARKNVADIIELAYPDAIDDPKHAALVARRVTQAVLDALVVGPQYNVSVTYTDQPGPPERMQATDHQDAEHIARTMNDRDTVERVNRHHRYCSPWHRTD